METIVENEVLENNSSLDEFENEVVSCIINNFLGKSNEPDDIVPEYDYYKSLEFWRSKFPTGWEYIPGFGEVIESIHEFNLRTENSPLKEMEARQNQVVAE